METDQQPYLQEPPKPVESPMPKVPETNPEYPITEPPASNGDDWKLEDILEQV